MAWELLETKDDINSMRSAVEEFESGGDVDSIDQIVPHKIGRNRVVLFVTYTEAAE